MKGDPEFVILKPAAWLDTAQYEERILGAVVRYPLKPSNDYVPADRPLQYNKSPLVEGTFANFLVDNTQSAARDASATLDSIAGFAWKGDRTASTHLQGKRLRCKRLQQHGQFWAQLKQDAAVRATVPGWISMFNTWPPCLVVGIMVVEDDVELDFSGSSSSEWRGDVTAPVGTVAAAAALGGAAAAGTSIGNAKVAAGSSKQGENVFRAASAHSRIFALELRMVTTRTLRRNELKLKEDGPTVEPGRFADAEASDNDADDDGPPDPDSLILENFTDEEYAEMDG